MRTTEVDRGGHSFEGLSISLLLSLSIVRQSLFTESHGFDD